MKPNSVTQKINAGAGSDVSDLHVSLPLRQEDNIGTLSPFVHKFQTQKNKYVFDINTGRIVKVDAIIWDIIDDFGKRSKDEIVREFSSRYKTSEICSAYDEIACAREHNKSFLATRPKQIVLPSEEKVRESINHESAWVVLQVTEDCNCRCRYCVYEDRYGTWGKRSKRRMEWEVARLAIDDFLEHCDYYNSLAETGGIAFYGGEPLLNFPLIKQCVEYVRKKVENDPPFHITTNGSLLRGEIADFSASERFYICVSLDGPAHIHDHCRIFRDGSGTWKVVIENIEEFLEKYPEYKTNGKLSLNVVLSPFGSAVAVEEFFSSFELFSTIKIEIETVILTNSELFDFLSPKNRRIPDIDMLYQKFLRNLASGAINKDPNNKMWCIQRGYYENKFRLFHNRDVAQPGKILSGQVGPRGTCIPGVVNPYVTVDGNYYPCEKFHLNEECRIGDVWQRRKSSKIHNMIMQFYRFNSTQCASCWCIRNCNIGCYIYSIKAGKLSEEAKRKRCEKYRHDMHDTLVDYCEIQEQNPHAFEYLKE